MDDKMNDGTLHDEVLPAIGHSEMSEMRMNHLRSQLTDPHSTIDLRTTYTPDLT